MVIILLPNRKTMHPPRGPVATQTGSEVCKDHLTFLQLFRSLLGFPLLLLFIVLHIVIAKHWLCRHTWMSRFVMIEQQESCDMQSTTHCSRVEWHVRERATMNNYPALHVQVLHSVCSQKQPSSTINTHSTSTKAAQKVAGHFSNMKI